MLTYVAELGEPIADGDTVGRSENEVLHVKYVTSPADETRTVWSIDLK
jgi:hypothetical protein